MNTDMMARRGYHAYGGITDWKNYRGDPMPKFDELPPKIQEAWVAFAARVAVGGTAEQGYQEYGKAVDWKNFEGKPIPQFAQPPMTETITNAWHAATKAINDALGCLP